jgi:hypothetical protein
VERQVDTGSVLTQAVTGYMGFLAEVQASHETDNFCNLFKNYVAPSGLKTLGIGRFFSIGDSLFDNLFLLGSSEFN